MTELPSLLWALWVIIDTPVTGGATCLPVPTNQVHPVYLEVSRESGRESDMMIVGSRSGTANIKKTPSFAFCIESVSMDLFYISHDDSQTR